MREVMFVNDFNLKVDCSSRYKQSLFKQHRHSDIYCSATKAMYLVAVLTVALC
jgi:hypothetical protein